MNAAVFRAAAALPLGVILLLTAASCASNTARTDDADQSASARDTTTADTLNGRTENPPGYRGMERDTTQVTAQQTPTDTFLQNQGTGQPQDTAGYSGMERQDTTGQMGRQEETDQATGHGADTSAAGGAADTVLEGEIQTR